MTDRRLYPSRALHGQVAHEIGRRIVEGTIPEGALLPREAELAAQFKVSRQAIREALKVLAAKGLVTSRRRTGTQVLPRYQWHLLDPDVIAWQPLERIPPDLFRDLLDLRQAIEPVAAEFAAVRGTKDQVDAIGRALATMRRALDDHDAFIAADVEFHSAIGVASGNVLFDLLSATYAPLLSASFELQTEHTPRTQRESDTLPSHTAVYEAIAARDPAGARRAMESLVAGSIRTIRAIVDKPPAAPTA